ncbi:MAG: MMPL family transporter [Candidatus Thermoplasmatota archaeon]|nr:MMPL family transporter [Candidatus Thermoplasmatota archaeon]MCL5731129.1 MMPL family transporter [Candidatus Thermoplasmatota archaeon]
MFEKQFRGLAKFSVKNRKKIIVIWILLFLILAPFALAFISNTSFNFANSLITKGSETYYSNLTFSQQFGKSAANGNGIVIVSTGTNVDSQKVVDQLIKLQNGLINYFKGKSLGFSGIESILTVEQDLLNNITAKIRTLQNSTVSIMLGISKQLHYLIPVFNSTSYMILGMPLFYLEEFIAYNKSGHSFSQSNSFAYNQTRNSFVNSTSYMQLSYLDNFSAAWNSTLGPNSLKDGFSAMNIAVNLTLSNSQFSRSLETQNYTEYNIARSVAENITLYDFSNTAQRSGIIRSLAILFISQSPATLSVLANLHLQISAFSFSYDSFNLSDQPSQVIAANSSRILSDSLPGIFSVNPEVKINKLYIQGYLEYLYGNSNSTSEIALSTLYYSNFTSYPILPSWFVFHQFVGYDNSTTITEATFSKNFGIGTVNSVSAFTSPYSKNISGSNFYVAGSSASSAEYEQQSTSGLVTALVIGILLSVIIVGIFFRSPIAAVIPLMIFGISAVISMGLSYLIYDKLFHSEASFITPTLLLILLLGITSDYVVYIMSRYRREVRVGSETPVENAGEWAGHAVFTSGLTVAVSYLILWLANVPLFSDSGITNAIGVSVTILLANTFLIALLKIFGDRLFWPSKPANMKHAPAEKEMAKIGSFVTTNKYKFLAIFVVISLIGIYIYMITPAGLDLFALLPQNSSTQALEAVNASFHGDFFERDYVIVEMPSPIFQNVSGNITYNNTEMGEINQLSNLLLLQPQISQVFGPTYPFGYYQNWNLSNVSASDRNYYSNPYTAQILSYFGNSSNYAIIYYQPSALAYSPYVTTAMPHLNTILAKLSSEQGYKYYNGGLSQGISDANTYSHSAFNEIVPIIVITVMIILFIQLSSIFTPIRLILMVLAMVIFSLVITYIYFFYILSLPIIIFLPMFVFVTLLAVGLDYDIFMITRVREEVIKGSSTDKAIRTSVSENGGVIIALGSILFVTFFALNFANFPILSEIGVGLALGILIDTFLSWPFLVPAIMTIMEKYNWWPSKLSR